MDEKQKIIVIPVLNERGKTIRNEVGVVTSKHEVLAIEEFDSELSELDSIFTQLQESDDRINADIVETSVLGRETRELLAELEKKVS